MGEKLNGLPFLEKILYLKITFKIIKQTNKIKVTCLTCILPCLLLPYPILEIPLSICLC